jgi:catechol 2,3-dioxygenase-like lactoylglutathione lyase family enzyme
MLVRRLQQAPPVGQPVASPSQVGTTSDSFKPGREAGLYGLGMPTFSCTEIVVSDMARGLAFYRRLGLEIPAAADTEPHVEVATPNGSLAFDTDATINSFDPGWRPGTGSPRVALAFSCADPAEVDKTYTDLTEAGYTGERPPFDAFWGQRYATVADPDGNHVDLHAPLTDG